MADETKKAEETKKPEETKKSEETKKPDETKKEETKREEEIKSNEEIMNIKNNMEKMDAKIDKLFESFSVFVDSGAIVRENDVDNSNVTKGNDFAQDFKTIEELDWSLD